jgi:ribosomal protein S18 acetylase RimI-like enzyme
VSGVRAALADDADAIGAIYAGAWRDAYPGLVPDRVLLGMTPGGQAEAWARTLRQDAGRGFVQVATAADGTVAGFGSCGRSRTAHLPFDGEVFTLYVDGESRGRGHGRALLRALLDRLAADGLRAALVWVLAGNPARHFYRAAGGRLVAEKTERLWGIDLPQQAFGWPDLSAALAQAGPLGERLRG